MAKIIVKKYIKKIHLEKKFSLKQISNFGNLVGDNHKLHKDIKFCKKKKFKSIVSQGLFVSSICSSFVNKIFSNNAIIIRQKFNYRQPVYINEKLKFLAQSEYFDKRFQLYKIGFKIYNKKKLKCDGEIIVKII